jgi:hypothetical protein
MDQSLTLTNARELKHTSMAHRPTNTRFPATNAAAALTALAIVSLLRLATDEITSLFVRLISHQPTVLFSQNKPATINQPTVLFSHNKSAPAISHQPNEQAVHHPL